MGTLAVILFDSIFVLSQDDGPSIVLTVTDTSCCPVMMVVGGVLDQAGTPL